MLDHLKKERQAGLHRQEKIRLSLYVAGMVVLGAAIFADHAMRDKRTDEGADTRVETGTSPDGDGASDNTAVGGTNAKDSASPVAIDRAKLAQRVEASGDAPFRYASGAIAFLNDQPGWYPRPERQLTPAEFITLTKTSSQNDDSNALVGRTFDIVGNVIDRTREVFRRPDAPKGDARLWSLVIEGEDGTLAASVSVGNESDVGHGAPLDTVGPHRVAETIMPGHDVVLRGTFLQMRTGTIGETILRGTTPVFFLHRARIAYPPKRAAETILELDHASWEDVRDRKMKDSVKLLENAVFQTIRWARSEGYTKIHEGIKSKTIPWTPWEGDTFDRWMKEIDVDEKADRPFTEAARGKLFRVTGMLADWTQEGWETVPRNPWQIDGFDMVTILSDHYMHLAIPTVMAFRGQELPNFTGKRQDHVALYGVFVKNYSYKTRFRSKRGGTHMYTVPLFVVLDAHPVVYSKDRGLSNIMVWIAAGMVLFALLFFLVIVPSGARQQKRMEAHRMALRRRARAAGQGKVAGTPPESPTKPDDSPTPD